MFHTPINIKSNHTIIIRTSPDVTIDLTIQFSYSKTIRRIKLLYHKDNFDNFITLSEILTELSRNVYLNDFQILFWSEPTNSFIYVGRFPIINTKIHFPFQNISLTLKLRQINKIEHKSIPSFKSRAKERRIIDVLKSVYKWRKLFHGLNSNGKIVKMNLVDAAERTGISKKSLDDYLIQIKLGRELGFDFNKYKFAKIGVLRAFIKSHKQ